MGAGVVAVYQVRPPNLSRGNAELYSGRPCWCTVRKRTFRTSVTSRRVGLLMLVLLSRGNRFGFKAAFSIDARRGLCFHRTMRMVSLSSSVSFQDSARLRSQGARSTAAVCLPSSSTTPASCPGTMGKQVHVSDHANHLHGPKPEEVNLLHRGPAAQVRRAPAAEATRVCSAVTC